MATLGSTTEKSHPPVSASNRTGFFYGRLGLQRREAALAYLFILPAILIIGLFGIFPLIFSIYQSTRGGINNIIGRPDGFGQYVRAIDNLAYVLAFWIAIIFVIIGINQIRELVKKAEKYEQSLWQWTIPGIITGLGFAGLIRWIFTYMPGLLEVGEKINQLRQQNSDVTSEEVSTAFRGFVGEAWTINDAHQTFWPAFLLIIAGLIIYQIFLRIPNLSSGKSGDYYSGFMGASLLFTIAGSLTWLTYFAINEAIAEAIEKGEGLPIWSQVLTISAGFGLLYLSWLIWSKAQDSSNDLGMFMRLGAAVLLMVAAWILIRELPLVIAEGKDDWWTGLSATTWYVLFALPVQISLGLLLATLMFGDIKGKTVFRMIYFLPYITPQVGAAVAFRIIFSGNSNGPMNQLFTSLGFESQGWLAESKGIFELIGANFGDWAWTEWLGGPSLALVVAIIFGVWNYTGYNMIFFMAGLGNISKDMYEAASMDGASRWQKFRNITFPLLSPTTYFLTLIGIIGIFKVFSSVYVLRSGQARGTMDTASIVIFEAFNRDTRYGYASALGIILLVIIIGVSTTANKLTQDKVFYE
ncbi:MAG: ABC-type sugar transport system permease subunit [Cellvibrionaceae bacterium]|jgi:ABC-type sugar transport system permease subunit